MEPQLSNAWSCDAVLVCSLPIQSSISWTTFQPLYDQFRDKYIGFCPGLSQDSLLHFFVPLFAWIVIADIICSFFSLFGCDSLDCCVSISSRQITRYFVSLWRHAIKTSRISQIHNCLWLDSKSKCVPWLAAHQIPKNYIRNPSRSLCPRTPVICAW